MKQEIDALQICKETKFLKVILTIKIIYLLLIIDIKAEEINLEENNKVNLMKKYLKAY